jgi:HlyD family secretion protein
MKIGFSGKWWLAGVLAAVVLGAGYAWFLAHRSEAPEAFAAGNGRLEATAVDIATKLQGRVAEILAREGDFVTVGQVVARMDTKTLEAQLRRARAEALQARAQKTYAEALLARCRSTRTLAASDYRRSQALFDRQSISKRTLERDRTSLETADAALAEARAQIAAADAAITAANAAAEALRSEVEDGTLTAPIAGRVLYRLAEPGEVLAAGGKVLTVLDLSDAYMSIYLPSRQAGRVKLGAEARIVFDALPQLPIPARITFVAPRAQFTPKEVETRTEREKLMFRVKVTIDPDLLKRHLDRVKTGVPGVAWVRLDESTPWPEDLRLKPLP